MTANRFLLRLGLSSATAVLAGATLLAQAPGGAPGGAPQQPAPAQPSQPGQSNPSTQPNMPGTNEGAAGTPQGMADQAFVSEAMQGNDAEIQLAQLAQQKSQSQDVKQYAAKMANDHQQMNQKWLEPVAKQMSISEPKGPSKKDKKEIAKLQGLNGDEFDKAYIACMLKDHQEDLKKFKEEADASQDPNVKQIATQGATIISQHLQLAQQVAKNHNMPVEGGKEVSSR